jgi:hypothetical protein
MPVNTTLQLRRGSGENWNSINPTLSNGELGLNTDNKLFKIGDGLTTWTSLPYYPGIPLSSGTGIGLSYSKDSNNIITGISISNAIRAGSNISLTLSGNDIVIAGSSPTTVSSGTGIVVNQTGDDYQINLDNEHVRDLIGGILFGNSGIGINIDDASNTITFSVTGILSTQINDFNSAVDARITAASISEEQVQDVIASGDHINTGFLRNGTGVYIDYNDSSNFVTINVSGYSLLGHTHDDRYYTETELNTSGGGGQVHWANVTNTPTGFTPASHSHVSTDITDFTEAVQDVVGDNAGGIGFLRNGSGISWTYNDSSNTLSVGVTGIPSSLITDFADAVSDQVDTTLSAGTGVVLNYNSNTNILTINTSGYALTSHNHIWSNITDASATATLNELAYLSGVTAGTVSASRAVVVDANKDVSSLRNLSASGDVTLGTVYVTNNLSTTGNVTINGNLSVNGTTTTIESTVTKLRDPIITIGSGDNPSSDDNKDRGIEFLYHNGVVAKTGFFGFDDSTGKFTFIPDATNTSEVFSGTKGEVDANVDWSNILNKPDPIITGTLTGDVTGTSSVTLTDLGNGTLSISTTLADNTVTSAKIVNGTIVNEDINASAAIAVTKLASSGITLGSTTINLGQTSTVIDGLTRISGVSANNPTYLYYAVIDGGTP